ncbi:MAG: hypothetical protein GF307_00655 [candidate division Zixibacteria bacterium]|nr:hypothetical protein [candidate division Zixibacteria bacterium]
MLSENTVVLNKADITDYNAHSGEIIFNEEVTLSLRPGDIVVSDTIGLIAPCGFLRKVTDINENTVSTAPATIEEAVKNCSAQKTVALSPYNATFFPEPDVQAKLRSPEAGDYDFAIDFEKYFYGGPQVDYVGASGYINFNFGYILNLVIQDNTIQHLSFVIVVDDDARIRLQSNIQASIQRDFRIGEFDMGCFVMYIPRTGFPVVLKPDIAVYVGAAGAGSAHFDVTVTRNADFEAGLKYDSIWGVLKNHDNEFGFDRNYSDEIDLNCYIQTRTNCLFYGLSGLNATIDTYLDANIAETNGEIRGGLEASAVIDPEMLSSGVPGYSNQIFRLEEILWEM